MRVATALLVGLGLTSSASFALAQTSTPAPATAGPRTQKASEPPRPPAFDYLGTLRAVASIRRTICALACQAAPCCG